MLQSIHVQDSRPMPRYKHWVVDGVRFTRATFEPGMWQDMRFPECGGYAEIDSCHIQPTGVLFDPAGVLAPREAGWMSSNDHWPIPAGVHRRVAIERAEVWCARPVDKVSSVAHISEICLQPGQELPLEPGHNLFLATGRLSCGAQALDPFSHLQISSDEKTLTAEALSYGFLWKEPLV